VAIVENFSGMNPGSTSYVPLLPVLQEKAGIPLNFLATGEQNFLVNP
jgi:hypothetical protein